MRLAPAFAALFLFSLESGFSDIAFAGEFEGLQPGVSKKADADRVLGTPVREVVPLEQYDYDPGKYDCRRISVRYYRDTQVIQTIDLFLMIRYSKDAYREWFKLNTPTRTESGANGNLVEYYPAEGMALHYAGSEVNSGVEYFSHFDPRMTAGKSAARTTELPPASDVKTPPGEAATPSRLRLGMILGAHEGQGFKIIDVASPSPASRARLCAGDVILEFGQTGLYETRIPPARVNALLAGRKPGQSIRLLIQRGTDRFETAVTPEERVSPDPEKQELAKAAYDQGRRLMDAGDFAGAARYFDQVISLDPQQPAGYAGLAESFYKRRNVGGEIEALKKGVVAAPGYRLYSLLGFAFRRGERWDDAINAFGKALDMMPGNVKDVALYEAYALCYAKKRRYREALGPLEAAYRINPRSPAAVYLLAGCHDALGHRDQAVKFYREYLGLADSGKTRVRYASRRLEALAKGNSAAGITARELIEMLETVVKEAARPDR